MDTISKGKYVALAYKIFVVGTEQDVPVYEFVEKHPDIFIFGYDFFMIEGFSKRIEGLKQGDTFDFTLTPCVTRSAPTDSSQFSYTAVAKRTKYIHICLHNML